MAVRSVDSVNQGVRDLHSVARWRAHARRHPLRYRLAVVAPSAVDVIRHAGGWLFDRTTAGWEVTVLVTDHSDVRPLRILGATVLDLEQSLATSVHDTWPNAVAVASETYMSDSRVREGVLDCFDRGLMEVAMWGDVIPPELEHRAGTAHHRVSVAARAFKACALNAAGHPAESVESTEAFRVGEIPPPIYRSDADLVPAT
ncbi:hypothetical protein AB0I48_23325 [Nocardia aurea]|uniref:Uncharacterized protein n=1 Tax=Nocardia aurea TaxID=2144174 RepID=A0ABV3FYQ9_9NOCA|nr:MULTISPECIES: hypothetical protein [Nocardia]